MHAWTDNPQLPCASDAAGGSAQVCGRLAAMAMPADQQCAGMRIGQPSRRRKVVGENDSQAPARPSPRRSQDQLLRVSTDASANGPIRAPPSFHCDEAQHLLQRSQWRDDPVHRDLVPRIRPRPPVRTRSLAWLGRTARRLLCLLNLRLGELVKQSPQDRRLFRFRCPWSAGTLSLHGLTDSTDHLLSPWLMAYWPVTVRHSVREPAGQTPRNAFTGDLHRLSSGLGRGGVLAAT